MTTTTKTKARAKPKPKPKTDLAGVLRWIEATGRAKVREGMARYAIPSDNAVGIPVGILRDRGKAIGKDHALAAGLWKAGGYEARMLACFVDDPALVTPPQMDRWCRDFDSWAICDTACFHLFDRTPYAFAKVDAWADRPEEFVKRAAFALLASVALHDKTSPDAPFSRALALIAEAATDDRNFVKKAVSWALRSIGKRNPVLGRAAVTLATRLAASENKATRWVGKDALRDLTGAKATKSKPETKTRTKTKR
jgi:3-methyladenine DNA glycosylase AlkD